MIHTIHTAFIDNPVDCTDFANVDYDEVTRQIAAYCRENWPEMAKMLGNPDAELPEDDMQAIEHYFEASPDLGDDCVEYLTRQTHHVDIPFVCPKLEILGPDGVTLHPEAYESLDELVHAAAAFPLRFLPQGHFRSGAAKIPLDDIPRRLRVIIDEDPDEDDEYPDVEAGDEEQLLLAGPYGTEKKLRKAFWAAHPRFAGEFKPDKEHNAYSVECRQTFHEWKDALQKKGLMPESVCDDSTL